MNKILLLISFLVLSACNNTDNNSKKLPKNDTTFNYDAYLYSHTSSIISKKSNITISFAKETNAFTDNNPLDKKLISISPKIEGTIKIIGNKHLTITPEKPLQEDTEYIVKVHLGKIFQETGLKAYNFSFKTKKQHISLINHPLQSYNKDWQYVNGAISSNEDIELDRIKKTISAKQNSKNISIIFDETNQTGTHFSYKIDSIYRGEDDSYVQIAFNGKAIGLKNKETREIQIHGKNNFKITNIQVVNEAEQFITVNFSDPIKSDQNLNGLIEIEDSKNPKYVIQGNTIKVYPSKTLKGDLVVAVYRGIKNTYNYKFKEDYIKTLSFDEPKPQIVFTNSGSILPNSENLKINFKTINLKGVEVTIYKIFSNNILQFLQTNNYNGDKNIKAVARPILKKIINLEERATIPLNQWQSFGIDLSNLIKVDKGAIYRIKLNIKRDYSLYKCNNLTGQQKEIKTESFDEEDIETSGWDYNGYYYEGYPYEYRWRERNNPCDHSYYRKKAIYKNVLASDLGITVKKGTKNNFYIACTNLITSKPEPDVNIEFLNYQQQVIATTKTDNNGLAEIEIKKTPFFAVATKNNNYSYIKLSDGNALSMSNFNTSGIQPQNGIKGFIYGERGVWRPGDDIFLSFMLNDKDNELPKDYPITLKLFDPNGVLKTKTTQTNNIKQLYSFTTKTQPDDITGNWSVVFSVGDIEFRKTLKIETVKPNRLKIQATIDDEIITNKSTIKIKSTWLHGAIAKNLKVESNVTLSHQKTTFKKYPSYIFDDPSKSINSNNKVILKGKLNQNGETNFTYNPNVSNKAPGMLRTTFVTKVFEQGGDFSTDVFNKTFSPFKTYVGIKRPVGDKARNMLLTDKKHLFELVTVNHKGKIIPNQNLEVRIYKVNRSWWWNNNNNLSQFSSTTFKTPVFSKNISTKNNGKATFEYELKYPEWGRYFIKVTNIDSGHSCGETVFIDWPGWAGKAKKGNQKEAAMLMLTTDKENYNVGEDILLHIPSSKGGHALVNIENSNSVLKSVWVETQKENTSITIKATKDMLPNAYISVTLLQPHSKTTNDLPIRLYGIKNVFVKDSKSILKPVLTTKNEFAPEEEITVKVSEKNNKTMAYTIAIVEEGLLDLTRFKTPSPWNYFYAKEALGIKTWDIYDDVIGAYGGKLNQIFSIGGDGSLGNSKNVKANRFKPVVIYKGPFSLDKGETNTHKIKIPKYIGAVRTMVVAHDPENEAYGFTDKSTPVKKPLMVLATAPRKVSKSEKAIIPVTLFVMDKNIKNVSVNIKGNDVFNNTNQTQQIKVNNEGEETLYFDTEVIKNGNGKLTIIAKNGKHKASHEIDILSFNPNKSITEFKDYLLQPHDKITIPQKTFGIKGSNHTEIEVSSVPQLNLKNRLRYLIRYPHGCLEQTTSAVFPQLYLTELVDLEQNQKQDISNHIIKAIEKIGNQQRFSGGFSYWPGGNYINEWATTYAGHFLLEAEKQGYILPINFKKNWIAYQTEKSKSWRRSNKHRDDLNQAYRLYALALAEKPQLSMMNRLREDSRLSKMAKLRLGLAYAVIGHKSVATSLMKNLQESDYRYINQNYFGSIIRNKAMALETFSKVNNPLKSRKLAEDIAKALNSKDYLNTQATAQSLIAIAKYIGQVEQKEIDLVVKDNKKHNIKTEKTFYALKTNTSSDEIRIENKGDAPIYIKHNTSGVPKLGEEVMYSENISVNVYYLNEANQTLKTDQITQGTSFKAYVSVENFGNKEIKHVAVNYKIPSGWEIINNRFLLGTSMRGNGIKHVDIRDNEIVYYCDIKKGQTLKFDIPLTATFLGKYYYPSTFVEAMYDDTFKAKTKGSWIEVVK